MPATRRRNGTTAGGAGVRSGPPRLRLAEVAGAQVVAAELDRAAARPRRRSPGAELLAELAARVEAAAGRRVDRARARRPCRMTRWRRSSGSGIGIADISACGVGVLLLPEEVRPVGQLGDPAEVHHRDAVADVLDDAHVVGDEQVGQAELALELLEQVQDLGLDRHVERGDRLVADDEVRLEDERPGDADALALAAGELVRVAPGVVRLEADQVHHLADLLAALGVGADAVDAQALADAVADRRRAGRGTRTGPGR